MPSRATLVVAAALLTAAGGAACWHHVDPVAAGRAMAALAATWAMLAAALQAAYARAPAVVVGLGGLAAVPVLVLLVLMSRGASRLARWLAGSGAVRTVRHARAVERPSADAWIELAGRGREPVPIAGELLRIGRDVDNDLVLAGHDLESFHAVIARTPDAGFVVVDTSGGAGSGPGIAVNGRRLASSPLVDGDRIALGETAIIFHRGARAANAPAAPASPMTH